MEKSKTSPPILSEEASRNRATLQDTARIFDGPLGIRSLSLTGLFLLACFYTVYFARDFILPVTLAIVLNFLLAPIVRSLRKFGVPNAIGAGLVIGMVLFSAGLLSYELSSPLSEWLAKLPETGTKIESKTKPIKKYLDRLSSTSEQIEKLTKAKSSSGPERGPQQVELKQSSLLDVLFSGTSKIVVTLLIVTVLLYFLLASGDLFLAKLVHVLPTLSDKKKAVSIAREIETHISKYLLTISCINIFVGVASSLLFWAMGLPNPALWGALAGLLNFVPTVGALSAATVVGLVSVTTFSSMSHAVIVPISFLGLTIFTGTFISPLIMGRRLTLNPVAIFLGLSFWGWLWGIPGALLAVPLLAMFKIFCDHIEPLAPIGEFLG